MSCRKGRSLLFGAHCWAPERGCMRLAYVWDFCMVWCGGLPYVWYYGITGHSMSTCMLVHDNMDGVHCLYACAWHICVRASACMVQCALCVRLHKLTCMCVRLYVKVFELCCVCRRGLTRIVRAMCVPAHAYTAANVYVCVCVRACLLMET